MRKGLFWLNDKQWALIEPHLPTNQTGPVRDDDRRVISGIIHMLQCGARWRDCPILRSGHGRNCGCRSPSESREVYQLVLVHPPALPWRRVATSSRTRARS